MIFFPRMPTAFRHCLILCVLILSESNCQAFVEFQEPRPLFESLTRAKALSSLQEHLSGPVYAPFHQSSGVFNHFPVDRLLALGVAVYSFAQAWQEWLVREVPNTPNTPNTDATVKAPSGQSQSGSSETATSGAVASSGAGAFGGSLNQGSGGDDDGDKWPDRTDYAQLLDIHDKDKQMEALLNHLAMTIPKVDSLGEKVNKFTEEMEKLKDGDDYLSLQTIKEALTKLNAQYCKLSISNGEQETRFLALEARIKKLESRIDGSERSSVCNHIVQRNGEILWKITNFNQKRQEAISGLRTALYSPLALTQEYGYQFCAKAYLNGFGCGKGSHLSLYFVIMKGEYDALQTWPFRKKITFMILDQGSGDHLVESLDPFEFLPGHTAFQIPKSVMNIATGDPEFMPLESLEEKEKQFVKDDVMFIRIIVD